MSTTDHAKSYRSFQKVVLILFAVVAGVEAMPGAQARLMDVHSVGETAFVKVVPYADATVGFEFCRNEDDKECQVLGGHKSYSVKELEYRREQLKRRGIVLTSADVGLLVIAVGTSVVGGIFAGTAATALIIVGGMGTVYQGISLATNLYTDSEANPMTEFRQAKAISPEVVANQPVMVKGAIEDYARDLDSVLKSLF